MLSVTRLLCGTATPGDVVRFGRHSSRLPSHLLHFSQDKRPVVVWNIVRRCNLHCAHCYSESQDRFYDGELSTEEAERVIDDLAEFGAPVILFSGGEPLLRHDILHLIKYVQQRGVRAVLSTNGTLITPEKAQQLADIGLSYVGISIDGPEPIHDKFRGKRGAFAEAIAGIRNCREVGLRVGLRVTITGYNYEHLDEIFDLTDREDIPRICMYHLAYAGRGDRIREHDLTKEQTRTAVDTVFRRARDYHARGVEKDILTVDNHADGVYLYLNVLQAEPERAETVYEMLKWQGGNQSGVAIGCIDNVGNVHPDQFSRHVTFGNVRERPFSEIWTDSLNETVRPYKQRAGLIGGRCAGCRFWEICNGNLRVRAESYTGDRWGQDPACYMTDEELGIVAAEPVAG